jgi:hypothetical protein
MAMTHYCWLKCILVAVPESRVLMYPNCNGFVKSGIRGTMMRKEKCQGANTFPAKIKGLRKEPLLKDSAAVVGTGCKRFSEKI